jgi:hypothetical protein
MALIEAQFLAPTLLGSPEGATLLYEAFVKSWSDNKSQKGCELASLRASELES